MDTQPLVSVLMTAYNREKYIANAIESVLFSDYENFELIIVDDCSADNTLNIAKEYALKDNRITVYKNEKNLGDYPNRNQSASYARGKYLKYCDSDEELYPYCIGIMVRAMEQFPEAALGLCHIPEDKKHPRIVSPVEAYQHHYFKSNFFHNAPTSTIINREKFEREGGFHNIRHRGDYDLWLRLAAKYPVVRLPPYLTYNFDHPDQEQRVNLLYKKALIHKISMSVLKQDYCPLSPDEQKKAEKIWRLGFIRQNIILALMKLKFKQIIFLRKECNIGLGEILQAAFDR